MDSRLLLKHLKGYEEYITPTFSEMLSNCNAWEKGCSDQWLDISLQRNVVYCFINTETFEYVYIGKTAQEFRKRFYGHINCSHNKKLREALAEKAGVLALEVYVLDSYRDASFLESYLIWRYSPIANISSNTKNKSIVPNTIDSQTVDLIIQDVKSGQSKSAVAKKHNVSLPTVYRHLAKAEQK